MWYKWSTWQGHETVNIGGSEGQISRSHEAENRFGAMVEASFSILLGRVAVLVLIFATYFFSQKKYAIHAIFPTASNILSAMQMNGCFFLFLLEMPLPTAVTER